MHAPTYHQILASAGPFRNSPNGLEAAYYELLEQCDKQDIPRTSFDVYIAQPQRENLFELKLTQTPAPAAGGETSDSLDPKVKRLQGPLSTYRWIFHKQDRHTCHLLSVLIAKFSNMNCALNALHVLAFSGNRVIARIDDVGDGVTLTLRLFEGSQLYSIATGQFAPHDLSTHREHLRESILRIFSTAEFYGEIVDRDATFAIWETRLASLMSELDRLSIWAFPVRNIRPSAPGPGLENLNDAAAWAGPGPFRRHVLGDMPAMANHPHFDHSYPTHRTEAPMSNTNHPTVPLESTSSMKDLLTHVWQDHPDSMISKAISTVAGHKAIPMGSAIAFDPRAEQDELDKAVQALLTFLAPVLGRINLAQLLETCITLTSNSPTEEVPTASATTEEFDEVGVFLAEQGNTLNPLRAELEAELSRTLSDAEWALMCRTLVKRYIKTYGQSWKERLTFAYRGQLTDEERTRAKNLVASAEAAIRKEEPVPLQATEELAAFLTDPTEDVKYLLDKLYRELDGGMFHGEAAPKLRMVYPLLREMATAHPGMSKETLLATLCEHVAKWTETKRAGMGDAWVTRVNNAMNQLTVAAIDAMPTSAVDLPPELQVAAEKLRANAGRSISGDKDFLSDYDKGAPIAMASAVAEAAAVEVQASKLIDAITAAVRAEGDQGELVAKIVERRTVAVDRLRVRFPQLMPSMLTATVDQRIAYISAESFDDEMAGDAWARTYIDAINPIVVGEHGGLKTTPSEDFPPGGAEFHSTVNTGKSFEVRRREGEFRAWELPKQVPVDKTASIPMPYWVYEALLVMAGINSPVAPGNVPHFTRGVHGTLMPVDPFVIVQEGRFNNISVLSEEEFNRSFVAIKK